ncbi:SymE family type I addiction module toxin [Erwinia sp. PsM31]|nr:SymE family type I addiction module toxin [Erwinia sp. PsM31]MDN4629754.1 SymE family type I addiction module toxin [Erwinia sp. PsM31]
MTTYYSRCPSINLKGNWLEETGFETGRRWRCSPGRGN